MGRWLWAGLLALVVGGCVSESQERLHNYNQDGLKLYQQANYAAAVQSFESALTLNPKDVTLLFNAGECYDHLNDGAKAEHYYNECLQVAPNHGPCRHALTALLVREGRWADAVGMVQSWLGHEPDRPDALVEDAWLFRQSGNLPFAQARLQQALEKEPHNHRALIELAQIYEIMNRPQRALELYERCLAEDPNQPEITARVNSLLAKLPPEERRLKPD